MIRDCENYKPFRHVIVDLLLKRFVYVHLMRAAKLCAICLEKFGEEWTTKSRAPEMFGRYVTKMQVSAGTCECGEC